MEKTDNTIELTADLIEMTIQDLAATVQIKVGEPRKKLNWFQRFLKRFRSWQ